MTLYARQAGLMLCALLSALPLAGCSPAVRPAPSAPVAVAADPSFALADSALKQPVRFIVYGDMRFTDSSETQASRPGARESLVDRIASERPEAVFLTGDVPWHGGNEADYGVYSRETAAWRSEQLRVFPVLGNHEFQQCAEQVCLEHRWQTFPELRGRRWYSLALGSELRFIALDSNASLLPGSEQSLWLQQQIDNLAGSVRFLVILLHHPPRTDAPEGVRANEAALAVQLAAAVPRAHAHLLVCGAHVHNYERFERDGIVFLVSGGGGAKPTPLRRSAAALYANDSFPNFHYLRFELSAQRLRGEMLRLTDPDAAAPGTWAVQDQFSIEAPRQ